MTTKMKDTMEAAGKPLHQEADAARDLREAEPKRGKAPFQIEGAKVEPMDFGKARVTWPDGTQCLVGGVDIDPEAAKRDAEAWKLGR